jgi:hypothetical protein
MSLQRGTSSRVEPENDTIIRITEQHDSNANVVNTDEDAAHLVVIEDSEATWAWFTHVSWISIFSESI